MAKNTLNEPVEIAGLPDWVWSEKPYPEGKHRIIVQRPGYCRSDDPNASARVEHASLLVAQEPFTRCAAWQLMEA